MCLKTSYLKIDEQTINKKLAKSFYTRNLNASWLNCCVNSLNCIYLKLSLHQEYFQRFASLLVGCFKPQDKLLYMRCQLCLTGERGEMRKTTSATLVVEV